MTQARPGGHDHVLAAGLGTAVGDVAAIDSARACLAAGMTVRLLALGPAADANVNGNGARRADAAPCEGRAASMLQRPSLGPPRIGSLVAQR